MKLYEISQGGCCHPNITHVVAETPECAAELVTTEDLINYDSSDEKWVILLNVDVSNETDARILSRETGAFIS